MRSLIGLILLVLILNIVSLDDLGDAFRGARFTYLVAAALLMIANIGVQILKWNYMLRFLKNISLKDMLASFFFGVTLGSFTPGQLGEYGGRAIHLPSKEWGTVIGLAVIDKLQMAGIMALCGIVSLIILFKVHSIFIMIPGALVSILIILPLIRFSIIHTVLKRLGLSKLKYAWVRQAAESLSLFTRQDIAVTTVLSILLYGIIYFQLYLLMNAFEQIGPLDSFLAYAAMMFSKTLLPFSIADLGIREFGLVYFASQLGFSAPAALASALLLFFINIVLPALVGLFFIPQSMSIPSIKQ